MKKIILVVAFLVMGAFSAPVQTNATGLAGPVELEGFAWVSTVGCISVNCVNDGLNGCGTSDYKVQIEMDGSLSGYAWSPNVGWIQFGGLSGFPSGSGTVSQNATANGTHPDLDLVGWARICSGAADVANCSGAANSNAGGWDGWVSLSGTDYDVAFVNSEATADSFAWGGPNTMGWIDFSPSGAPPVTLASVVDITIPLVTSAVGTPDAGGVYDSVSFFPSIQGIPVGETVDWELTLGALTDSGTVTQTASGPDFSSTPALANVQFNVPDTLVFEVDMPAPGSVSEIDEINVYNEVLSLAVPPPTIQISGPEVIRSDETAEVAWEIAAPYAVTCSVQGPGINETVVVSGMVGTPDTQSGSSESSVLQNATRFEASCTVGADVYTEIYQVDVVPNFQEI